MMDWLEIWMVIIGLSMAVGVIPQGYRLWQRKTSDDIAILPWIVLIHGSAWWLIYGIQKESICLIVTNSISIIIDTTIFIMILKYRSKKNDT